VATGVADIRLTAFDVATADLLAAALDEVSSASAG
jgi:hypothetical protein